jgi:hypothetical protein
MTPNDLSTEDYDEFYSYWKNTFESDENFKSLGAQIQTISFTHELSKFVENKMKELT